MLRSFGSPVTLAGELKGKGKDKKLKLLTLTLTLPAGRKSFTREREEDFSRIICQSEPAFRQTGAVGNL